jgi:hypothetical protein
MCAEPAGWLTRQLEDPGEEVAAARAADRAMITHLNLASRKDARPGREPVLDYSPPPC